MHDSTRLPITLTNLTKSFDSQDRGKITPVKNVSITFNPGELTCILGQSGCGKTTLLRLISGLIKPSAGKVEIGNDQILQHAKNVASVNQSGDLLPWLNVLQNVAFGLEIAGFAKAERNQCALKALNSVNLDESIANSMIWELSGGMRQRVALARALCFRASIMLMDEPFASLDEPTRHQLQDMLIRLHREMPVTTVFVTHSIEEALYLADRIVVFSKGEIVADIPVELGQPRDRFCSEFIGQLLDIRKILAAHKSEIDL